MLMEYKDVSHIYLPRDGDDVKKFLTYDDKSVDQQIKILKNKTRYRGEWALDRIAELKAQRKVTLLWYDLDHRPYTLAGLWPKLKTRFKWDIAEYPLTVSPTNFPYQNPPKHQNRYYQTEAFHALKQIRHGAIELPTASGKTAIVRDLCKVDAVKTIVAVPFSALANQLYDDLVNLFGSKWVGLYGDGKKEHKKLITVAVAASLIKVKPDSDAAQSFNEVKRLVVDEAHLFASESLSSISLSLINADERYYVSATQMRNDGSGLLLEGITGPVVYRKTFKDLRDQGFLAIPRVRIFDVAHNEAMPINGYDAKTEMRCHLYTNPHVNDMVASVAERMVNSGRQTIILVEEFDQAVAILNRLKIPATFLHGGVTKESKETVPKQYWECDTTQTVKDFNAGLVKCVVGTTAVSTGTDFIPVKCLIYVQGGTSEIKIKQGAGRATRMCEGKTDFFLVDFNIKESKILERHADIRQAIYADLSDDIQRI